MRTAEVVFVEAQDELKLVVVESAELTKSLLDLLHQVHVLCCLRIHCHITRVGCVNRSVQGALAFVGALPGHGWSRGLVICNLINPNALLSLLLPQVRSLERGSVLPFTCFMGY